jgi:hypothetical protein
MISIYKKIYIYAVLFFFIVCSSIQVDKTNVFYSTEPQIDFYKLVPTIDSDPTIRNYPNFTMQFVWKDSSLEEWKEDIQKEILQSVLEVEKNGYVNISASVFEKEKSIQKEILLENEIDSVLQVVIQRKEDIVSIDYHLWNQAMDKKIGSFHGKQKIIQPNEDQKSVELFRKEKKYNLISKNKASYLQWIERWEPKQFLSYLQKSISGEIRFYSSAPAELVCDGKQKGNLPTTVSLVAGVHQCQFFFSGSHKISNTYKVKSGEFKEVFIEDKRDSNLHSIQVLSFPQGLGIHIDNEFVGYTPVYLQALKRQKSQVSYSRFIQYGEYKLLYKTDLALEKGKFGKVLFPLFFKNSYSSISNGFWEIPENNPFSVEMDDYISFWNDTKEFLGGWAGIASYPLVPNDYEIRGEFFLPEHTGEGIFQFGLDLGNKILSMEVEVDRVSIFEFPSRKDKITFRYISNDSDVSRPFRIHLDQSTKQIKIYANSEMVYRTEFDPKSSWRVLLCAKGGIFNRINILKSLQIEAIKLTESKDKL